MNRKLGRENTESLTDELIAPIFRPEARPDPYPYYAAVRQKEPITLDNGRGIVIASFEACSAALRDKRLRSDRTVARGYSASPATGATPEVQSLLFMDPPDHTRLRGLIQRAFTPRVIEGMQGFVRTRVDDLIDAMAENGRIEAVKDLAYPLPLSVICHMLGIADAEFSWLHSRAAVLPRAFDPTVAIFGTLPPGHGQRVVAEREMNDYFTELSRERLRRPGDDVVSSLARINADSDRLSGPELANTCRLLLNAGHETTVNLIGNTLLALLRHPHEHRRLQADPGLAPAIVEEIMRWDSPVHMLQRFVPEDTRFRDTELKAGDTVVIFTAAAHRDPTAFTDADSFSPGRADCRHLGFGVGIHFCLGAAVARMELRHAIPRFFQRVVEPAVVESSLRYREQVAIRGLERMAIEFTQIKPRDLPWTT